MPTSVRANVPPAIRRTSAVVVAYISRNPLPAKDLPLFIGQVHDAFNEMRAPVPAASTVASQLPTSAEIVASVKKDHIVSFINGKPYKTLKRHLAAHGLSSFSYRARYGLPDNYPMVAASYAQKRSLAAKRIMHGVEAA